VRAIAIMRNGGPEEAAFHDDLPDPTPGLGWVRVAVRASALNHLDLWSIRGIPGVDYHWPWILGGDGAGVIDAVGEGVDEARVGEEVVINGILSCGRCERCVGGERQLCRQFGMVGEHADGTHADYVVVPAIDAVPKPASMSFEDAAAGGVVYATAYRMLFTKARVRPGDVCLIHGIGGGLATAALQLARTAGLVCVVTSSDDDKLRRAAELGAHHGVNYRTGDVVREVRKAVGSVDVVIDSVGEAVWDASIRLLANGGRLVNCGVTGGDQGRVPIRHLFWRQLEILGSTMATDDEFRAALRAVERNGLHPLIDRTVPLEEAPAALRSLAAGKHQGKIVVTR
jgi:NADPH:quinone reductase-like Zn-dependent oxidoreductase